MKRILVIDDDESTRLLISRILESRGYETILAKNGIEGMRLALSHHPDLITVDVMMPYLNGLNFMKILTMMRLEIPSIFVTVKEEVEKYQSVFPYVKNFCLKGDLKEKLVGMVEETLNLPDRGYTDIEYTLKEKEIFGLLGKSDRKKILVVSDNDTFDFVTVMLGDAEIYELYHTSDGLEAVFKAVMIKPDLIVTDIDVPNINGISLAKILFILGHPFPIIYLSEKADVETIQKASSLEGIQGYLLKSEVQKAETLLQNRVEEILEISEDKKKVLQASYKAADIDKIGEFESGSSIWLSLSP